MEADLTIITESLNRLIDERTNAKLSKVIHHLSASSFNLTRAAVKLMETGELTNESVEWKVAYAKSCVADELYKEVLKLIAEEQNGEK